MHLVSDIYKLKHQQQLFMLQLPSHVLDRLEECSMDLGYYRIVYTCTYKRRHIASKHCVSPKTAPHSQQQLVQIANGWHDIIHQTTHLTPLIARQPRDYCTPLDNTRKAKFNKRAATESYLPASQQAQIRSYPPCQAKLDSNQASTTASPMRVTPDS